MMTLAKVVETLVTTTNNSPSQECTHPDDQTTLLHVTPGLKPFTVLKFKKLNSFTFASIDSQSITMFKGTIDHADLKNEMG